MEEIKSIGFALAPNNVPSFLLDWELTRKCNLDCSYCGIEGHDNSTQHPDVKECLKSIDFMYNYVNLYMQNKKPSQRKVVLNVYGGESLFHPNIVEILQACKDKYKLFENDWELTITSTTNAVINKSIWKKILPLIDEFTVSYHAENLPKQEKLFFQNLLELQQNKKRVKCVIMMHNKKELWPKSINAIEFCKSNGIRYIAKPFDNSHLYYTKEQFDYIKSFWNVSLSDTKSQVICINEGRACCGGRKLSTNNDLKSSITFVNKQGFRDWYCSVNWFFLFVQQQTGLVYVNKDCRMSFNGTVGPIGTLDKSSEILTVLENQLTTKSMPIIQCAKSTCLCGYCAPKAENISDFKELISRNVVTDVIKYN